MENGFLTSIDLSQPTDGTADSTLHTPDACIITKFGLEAIPLHNNKKNVFILTHVVFPGPITTTLVFLIERHMKKLQALLVARAAICSSPYPSFSLVEIIMLFAETYYKDRLQPG